MADFTDTLTLILKGNDADINSKLTKLPDTAKTNAEKVEGAMVASGATAGKGFGSALVGGAGAALTGLGGLLAAGGAGALLNTAIDASVDAARSQAQLEAALKSTGGQAGVTADGIGVLSKALQDQNAVEDDVIKRSAALLLTFRSVKNETGDGNNIFNQALSSALDLSAALDQNLQQSVIQVGKALNDPIVGMTALRRVGVTFTEQQRDQIKVLTRSGDLLGAQKVILSELKAEFEGTAAALAKADPFQRLGVALDDLQERIGKDVTPIFSAVVDGADKMFDAFANAPAPIRSTIEALAGLSIGAVALSGVIKGVSALRGLLGAGGSAAAATAAEALAVAEAEHAVAAQAAAAAEAELDAVIAAGIPDQAAYATAMTATTAATEAETVAAERLAAAQAQASAARVGFLGTLVRGGVVVAGAVLGMSALIAVENKFLGSAKNFRTDTAVTSLTQLGKTGEVTGLVLDAFGDHFQNLRTTLDRAGDQSTYDKISEGFRKISSFGGIAETNKQQNFEGSKKAVADLDKALAEMAKAGGEAGGFAAASFEQVRAEALKAGVGVETINRDFNDYLKVVTDAGAVSPFSRLSGELAAAEAQLRDLLTRQAGGEHVDTGAIVAARQRVVDVATKEAAITREVSDAEEESGAAAESAAAGLKTFEEVLAGIDGTASHTLVALNDLVTGPLAKIGAQLDFQDKLNSIADARDKLAEDKADAAGTGDKAVAAAKAETDAKVQLADANRGVGESQRRLADAHVGVGDAQVHLTDSYIRLEDAQERVLDSTRQLEDAQKALDDYNSARGVKERELQLDIIQRRVVTTPAESDQKQLDLLRFEDENANKQEQLQDAVTSGLRGVRDAYRGVSEAQRSIVDAQRGIVDAAVAVADAERGVGEAADKVKTAQDRVRDAVDKRRKTHDDAAKAVVEDEGKVVKALIDTAGFLDQAAFKGLIVGENLRNAFAQITFAATAVGPGGEDRKKLFDFLDQFNNKLTQTNLLSTQFGDEGTLSGGLFYSKAYRERLNSIINGTFNGPPSPDDLKALHDLGVPGYAAGGIAETHDAQIAAAGPVRMWAEPETGGEAYIPLSPAKRSRSTTILGQVAERFGLHLVEKSKTSEKLTERKVEGAPSGTQYAAGDVTDVTYAEGGIAHALTTHAGDTSHVSSYADGDITHAIMQAMTSSHADGDVTYYVGGAAAAPAGGATSTSATTATSATRATNERSTSDRSTNERSTSVWQKVAEKLGLVEKTTDKTTEKAVAGPAAGDSTSNVTNAPSNVAGASSVTNVAGAQNGLTNVAHSTSNTNVANFASAQNTASTSRRDGDVTKHFADGDDVASIAGDTHYNEGAISAVHFAGGTENHVAQIAQAGEMRVWAEPETGGEAYIPLSVSKRERSTSILRQVAEKFGFALEKTDKTTDKKVESSHLETRAFAVGDIVAPGGDTVRYFADGGVTGGNASQHDFAQLAALQPPTGPTNAVAPQQSGVTGQTGAAALSAAIDKASAFRHPTAPLTGTFAENVERLTTAISEEKSTIAQHHLLVAGITAALPGEREQIKYHEAQAKFITAGIAGEEKDVKRDTALLGVVQLLANYPLAKPGTIDVTHRGGAADVAHAISVQIDGAALLLPTAGGTRETAIERYYQTKENLGTFSSISSANTYAELLRREQTLQLPEHGDGGIFTQKHYALVAEKGPEAVLPLNNPGRAMQILAQTKLLERAGLPQVSTTSLPALPPIPAPNVHVQTTAGGDSKHVEVNQVNHFGGDAPSIADLEYANRALGWKLARSGRGS